jgi:predicted GNAT superfamily acetyltransferase
MSEAAIEVRRLTATPEFKQVVDLQAQIWGFNELELLPVRLFVVAEKIGGQVFGAFDAARMVGFLLSLPGLKPGGRGFLHSHMLGVLPEHRNRRIGRQMKLAQREDALERGIDLVEWTFDPLELKNAWFNIESLGAIARRYVENQYGTTTSHLHGGLPTDRLVAEWWLARAGEPKAPAEARVEVPCEIDTLRSSDPARAREIQRRIAGEFQEAFRSGLAVIGFERSAEKGAYLLGPWR